MQNFMNTQENDQEEDVILELVSRLCAFPT